MDYVFLNGGVVSGMTGTMGTSVELAGFARHHKFEVYVQPRQRVKLLRKKPRIICYKSEQMKDSLAQCMNDRSKNDPNDKKRAFYVITDDPLAVDMLYSTLPQEVQGYKQFETYIGSHSEDLDEFVDKVGKYGTCGITSQAGGRGVSVSPEDKEKHGLTVIRYAPSGNETGRLKGQNIGRAARNGAAGTYIEIVSIEGIDAKLREHNLASINDRIAILLDRSKAIKDEALQHIKYAKAIKNGTYEKLDLQHLALINDYLITAKQVLGKDITIDTMSDLTNKEITFLILNKYITEDDLQKVVKNAILDCQHAKEFKDMVERDVMTPLSEVRDFMSDSLIELNFKLTQLSKEQFGSVGNTYTKARYEDLSSKMSRTIGAWWRKESKKPMYYNNAGEFLHEEARKALYVKANEVWQETMTALFDDKLSKITLDFMPLEIKAINKIAQDFDTFANTPMSELRKLLSISGVLRNAFGIKAIAPMAHEIMNGKFNDVIKDIGRNLPDSTKIPNNLMHIKDVFLVLGEMGRLQHKDAVANNVKSVGASIAEASEKLLKEKVGRIDISGLINAKIDAFAVSHGTQQFDDNPVRNTLISRAITKICSSLKSFFSGKKWKDIDEQDIRIYAHNAIKIKLLDLKNSINENIEGYGADPDYQELEGVYTSIKEYIEVIEQGDFLNGLTNANADAILTQKLQETRSRINEATIQLAKLAAARRNAYELALKNAEPDKKAAIKSKADAVLAEYEAAINNLYYFVGFDSVNLADDNIVLPSLKLYQLAQKYKDSANAELHGFCNEVKRKFDALRTAENKTQYIDQLKEEISEKIPALHALHEKLKAKSCKESSQEELDLILGYDAIIKEARLFVGADLNIAKAPSMVDFFPLYISGLMQDASEFLKDLQVLLDPKELFNNLAKITSIELLFLETAVLDKTDFAAERAAIGRADGPIKIRIKKEPVEYIKGVMKSVVKIITAIIAIITTLAEAIAAIKDTIGALTGGATEAGAIVAGAAVNNVASLIYRHIGKPLLKNIAIPMIKAALPTEHAPKVVFCLNALLELDNAIEVLGNIFDIIKVGVDEGFDKVDINKLVATINSAVGGDKLDKLLDGIKKEQNDDGQDGDDKSTFVEKVTIVLALLRHFAIAIVNVLGKNAKPSAEPNADQAIDNPVVGKLGEIANSITPILIEFIKLVRQDDSIKKAIYEIIKDKNEEEHARRVKILDCVYNVLNSIFATDPQVLNNMKLQDVLGLLAVVGHEDVEAVFANAPDDMTFAEVIEIITKKKAAPENASDEFKEKCNHLLEVADSPEEQKKANDTRFARIKQEADIDIEGYCNRVNKDTRVKVQTAAFNIFDKKVKDARYDISSVVNNVVRADNTEPVINYAERKKALIAKLNNKIKDAGNFDFVYAKTLRSFIAVVKDKDANSFSDMLMLLEACVKLSSIDYTVPHTGYINAAFKMGRHIKRGVYVDVVNVFDQEISDLIALKSIVDKPGFEEDEYVCAHLAHYYASLLKALHNDKAHDELWDGIIAELNKVKSATHANAALQYCISAKMMLTNLDLPQSIKNDVKFKNFEKLLDIAIHAEERPFINTTLQHKPVKQVSETMLSIDSIGIVAYLKQRSEKKASVFLDHVHSTVDEYIFTMEDKKTKCRAKAMTVLVLACAMSTVSVYLMVPFAMLTSVILCGNSETERDQKLKEAFANFRNGIFISSAVLGAHHILPFIIEKVASGINSFQAYLDEIDPTASVGFREFRDKINEVWNKCVNWIVETLHLNEAIESIVSVLPDNLGYYLTNTILTGNTFLFLVGFGIATCIVFKRYSGDINVNIAENDDKEVNTAAPVIQ